MAWTSEMARAKRAEQSSRSSYAHWEFGFGSSPELFQSRAEQHWKGRAASL